MDREQSRLEEARSGVPWRKWGPYSSERQWGTVREDYSESGNAWSYFSHDQARSRAYRRGEDGLAGISDEAGRLCFALALWNGRDPILKERLFGLTNEEGNHGEDVKEYYYYLDCTPTHSYMPYLYKYPQAEFPYTDLVQTNRSRSRSEPEYELIDTGVFDQDRYFDVFVEYAKADPEDILVRITIHNRGAEAAPLHVLPTLWFRNTWSWTDGSAKPRLWSDDGQRLCAEHETLGRRWLVCEGLPELLFTENETNEARVFGAPRSAPYVKDGVDRYIVHGDRLAVNPARTGTKAAVHYRLEVPAGGQVVLRARLCDSAEMMHESAFRGFDAVFRKRQEEADEFYAGVIAPELGEDETRVARQALSGMLWSKQLYSFDVQAYLAERGIDPLNQRARVRNRDWFHMVNEDIISMPDKWEYPWYAAWDLAFHAVPLAMVDIDFAKSQLDLMVSELYLHPSGQIPAYEWNFGDVNPPVHAWAALFLFRAEQAKRGKGDSTFLRRVFNKLMMNFTWWVNKKDRFGRNVFEGGFLGLDNIGVFDRSAPLPGGGCLEQADGTGWMALYCQNMLEICVQLAEEGEVYEDLAIKFMDHLLWIARAMNQLGPDGMWDEEDGFYYDVLRTPDGNATRLKVRSLVGLLPLCATTVFERSDRERLPRLLEHLRHRVERMPDLRNSLHPSWPTAPGHADRGITALVRPDRLRRILAKVLDEREFLGPYGVRSLSRYHAAHPYVMHVNGVEYRVEYRPAESDSGLFGGNSNWRGPVWAPMNGLLIRALLQFFSFHGDEFRVECPTGSGRYMNLFEVAREISDRMARIFLRDPVTGRRPVFGGAEKFQRDPHFRDYLLFYEYFHGDDGAGIGASHQTGWTGIVAKHMDLFARQDARAWLEHGRRAAFTEVEGPRPGTAAGSRHVA